MLEEMWKKELGNPRAPGQPLQTPVSEGTEKRLARFTRFAGAVHEVRRSVSRWFHRVGRATELGSSTPRARNPLPYGNGFQR